MRKICLATLLLFLFAGIASAQCTGSSPTWTTTIDQSSVNTCISNATSGDTINVSSGSASWTSVTISSSKALTLACPSMSCIVTMTAVDVFDISVGTGPSTGTVITGFTFDVSNTGFEGDIQLHLVSSASGPYAVAPRFYNNTISIGSSTQTAVTTDGFGPALWDHNTITGGEAAAETFHIDGGGVGCQPGCYNEDVTPGGANMAFFENNSWSAGSAGFCEAEEAYYGAVFVLRYNQLTNCQVDIHADNGSGPGGRWGEWYNNQYINCCTSGEVIDWRGGSGVYWGNTVTNFRSGTNITVGPIGSDQTGTPPVQYQLGTGIGGTTFSPVYIWGSSVIESPSFAKQGPTDMTQIGTSPNSCSGYVGTDCNVVYSSTGAQPTTLLRCQTAADETAGCPVSYTYTPYTYPHPLDNCPSTTFGVATGCASGPPAPSGLTATVNPTVP